MLSALMVFSVSASPRRASKIVWPQKPQDAPAAAISTAEAYSGRPLSRSSSVVFTAVPRGALNV